MPNTYETLDKQIVDAIAANPRCDVWAVRGCCWEEVCRIALHSDRAPSFVLNGRLQALRKKGVIEYVPTAGDKRAGGW